MRWVGRRPGDGNKAGMCEEEANTGTFCAVSYQSPVEEVVRGLRTVAWIVPAANPHKPPGQRHMPGK